MCGDFSLTLRYTGWFHVRNVWLITVAAALLQVWAILSLSFCDTSFGEMAIIITSTLLALISHAYRNRTGDNNGRRQIVVRRRIELNTMLCAFYLSLSLKDKKNDTCEVITITFLAGVLLLLLLDEYLQIYFNYIIEKNTKKVNSFI